MCNPYLYCSTATQMQKQLEKVPAFDHLMTFGCPLSQLVYSHLSPESDYNLLIRQQIVTFKLDTMPHWQYTKALGILEWLDQLDTCKQNYQNFLHQNVSPPNSQ